MFRHELSRVFPYLFPEGQGPVDESLGKVVAMDWCSLVEAYSQLDLTYEKDRLPALSGIVSRARPIINAPYVAGTWQCHLPDALLWVPYRSSRWDPREKTIDPEPLGCRSRSQPRCPTWSWAAIEGEVTFRFAERCPFEGNGPPLVIHTFGPVRSTDYHGTLNLSGSLVPVTVHYRTAEKQCETPRYWLRRSPAEDLWEYFVPDLVIEDDAQYSNICNGTELACLHVRSAWSRKEDKVFEGVPDREPPRGHDSVKHWITVAGLVLKRLPEGDEIYERIGYFQRSEYVYHQNPPENKLIGNDSWFEDAEVRRITLV